MYQNHRFSARLQKSIDIWRSSLSWFRWLSLKVSSPSSDLQQLLRSDPSAQWLRSFRVFLFCSFVCLLTWKKPKVQLEVVFREGRMCIWGKNGASMRHSDDLISIWFWWFWKMFQILVILETFSIFCLTLLFRDISICLVIMWEILKKNYS